MCAQRVLSAQAQVPAHARGHPGDSTARCRERFCVACSQQATLAHPLLTKKLKARALRFACRTPTAHGWAPTPLARTRRSVALAPPHRSMLQVSGGQQGLPQGLHVWPLRLGYGPACMVRLRVGMLACMMHDWHDWHDGMHDASQLAAAAGGVSNQGRPPAGAGRMVGAEGRGATGKRGLAVRACVGATRG